MTGFYSLKPQVDPETDQWVTITSGLIVFVAFQKGATNEVFLKICKLDLIVVGACGVELHSGYFSYSAAKCLHSVKLCHNNTLAGL